MDREEQRRKIEEAERLAEQAEKDAAEARRLADERRRQLEIEIAAEEAAEEARRREAEENIGWYEEPEHEEKHTESKGSGIRGFVAGVALTAILTGGYFLVKNNLKKGDTKSPVQTYVSEDTLTVNEDNNRIIVNTNGEETEVVIRAEEEATEPNYSFNYEAPVVVPVDNNEPLTVAYDTLTNDKFESLAASNLKMIKDKGLTLNEADVLKFVAIVNINKLSQDNPELLASLIGNQNPDEFRGDSQKVLGASVMYNYQTYLANGNDNDFIKLSSFVFDETEKAKVIEVENRVHEIGLNKDNNEEMNALVNKLLRDLASPTSSISYFEPGVGFGLQLTLEPVRGLYGMAKDFMTVTLDDTNADLIKYFVPYAEDEQKYVDNAQLTGYFLMVNDILADCTNTSSRTK